MALPLSPPDIDPVLLHLGPFQLRWYSLLYLGGFIVARFILRHLAKDKRFGATPDQMDELVLYCLFGDLAFARLFYCVFYQPKLMLANPLFLFQFSQGGLSFHGGMVGVMAGAFVFGRKNRIPVLKLIDALALAAPTGLAMGRLGNFLNGELWGRATNVPWAMVFKSGGPWPRHPSQLYELFLEGIVLFAFLWWLKGKTQRDGAVMLAFGAGYSVCRFIAEMFREPDAQLGYLAFGLTMGQLLSIAQVIASVVLAAVLFSPSRDKAKAA